MYEDKAGNDGDRSDLAALVTALEAPDDSLLAGVEAIVDLDDYVSFWATEVLVGHWDGHSGNRNNHYLYRNPTDGKFRFLPWSPDDGFGQPNPFINYVPPASVWANATLPRRLYRHPEGKTRYQARMRELLADVWDETELHAEIDRMEALLAPHIHVSEAQFQDGLTNTREYIDRIRGDIEASLAEDPGWDHTLPDGFCLVSGGTITSTFTATWGQFPAANPFLTGSGTLEVVLDGAPAEVFTSVGVTIGPTEDPSNPKVGLAVFGMREDGTLVFPYMLIDPDRFATQSPLAVDAYEVFAFLLDSTGAGQYSLLGFVRGTLTIDQAEPVPGGTVAGSFAVELILGRTFE
jgi:hypothetical protein